MLNQLQNYNKLINKYYNIKIKIKKYFYKTNKKNKRNN